MKTHEARDVRVGQHSFHIFPFPAFTAASLSGELMNLVLPIITSVLPYVGSKDSGGRSLMDVDIDEAAPAIAGAFGSISGPRLEAMLKKLLVVHRNVTVEVEDGEGSGRFHAERLTEDLANELFCGEIQDMFVLAFHVIRLNLNGFFEKASGLFGGALGDLMGKAVVLNDTATSI